MNQRTKKKLKLLGIGIVLILATLLLVHVFNSILFPWIIKMHR